MDDVTSVESDHEGDLLVESERLDDALIELEKESEADDEAVNVTVVELLADSVDDAKKVVECVEVALCDTL